MDSARTTPTTKPVGSNSFACLPAVAENVKNVVAAASLGRPRRRDGELLATASQAAEEQRQDGADKAPV